MVQIMFSSALECTKTTTLAALGQTRYCTSDIERQFIIEIHSFILETYIAPLQDTTTQRRSVHILFISKTLYYYHYPVPTSFFAILHIICPVQMVSLLI